MKKTQITILLLVILALFTLSACSSSEDEVSAEIPSAYSELLEEYFTALTEKWDGETLINAGLNLIALDLYDGAQLDSIGYAIMDIDGNGIDELAIGTTDVVTDEFYSKMIFDLYTLDQDGTLVQVFSSMARDRYYYAGEQLFVNIASSSKDDTSKTTFIYEGIKLTETYQVIDIADYVQMDLTALSFLHKG